jgi:hypothetical protein
VIFTRTRAPRASSDSGVPGASPRIPQQSKCLPISAAADPPYPELPNPRCQHSGRTRGSGAAPLRPQDGVVLGSRTDGAGWLSLRMPVGGEAPAGVIGDAFQTVPVAVDDEKVDLSCLWSDPAAVVRAEGKLAAVP